MYRRNEPGGIEVLLAHPGGPYWQRKDAGAWTLPKGEYEDPEDPLAAALREWHEETGFPAAPPFAPLGEAKMKSGKRIHVMPGARMRCMVTMKLSPVSTLLKPAMKMPSVVETTCEVEDVVL